MRPPTPGIVGSFKCYPSNTKLCTNIANTMREEVVSVARVRKTESSEPIKPMRPALNPEARENQLISLAVDCAEKQLREGTASSQVITHFLKLATEKERLEREKIRQEIELQKAKTKALASDEEIKAMYKDAIDAMKKYSGYGDQDDDY